MSSFSSLNGPLLTVGSQLSSGITKAQIIPYSKSLYGGLSILNGPVQIGVAPLLTPALGTVYVGPVPPTSGPASLAGMHVFHPTVGINVFAPIAANFNGIVNTNSVWNSNGVGYAFGLMQFLGVFNKIGKSVEVGGTTKAEPNIEEAAPNRSSAGNMSIAGNLSVVGTVNATGNVTAPTFVGALTGVASGNKLLSSFDIPHVRQKNKRIRHIVAEGPEPGIYIRGTLKGSNKIDLPEYWDGLIDPESITVTLTSVGSYQELYVDKIEWGKTVIVKNNQGSSIHCYYEIWAARWVNPMNTEEKLHVVYEGETPDDYPGGNNSFLIGGWDYDRRNTQWEGGED
jgi:hypothetical protein